VKLCLKRADDNEGLLMTTRTPQEIWEAALGELQIQVSKPNYRTWFEKTLGLSYQDNQFVIGVPNSFVAEYLEKNQRSLIEKALIGLTSPGVQVVFQINGVHHERQPRSAADAKIPAGRQTHLSRLNPKYNFDSFIEGSNNRLARSAALAVAMNPGRNYNPLFIYGGVGLGKTHLLHAIGHTAVANDIPVICVSAEHFTNEFVAAIRERKTEEFRHKYRGAGMLLVDDIQFISGKEQTVESFFHTFNELHNSNRQVVITSDRPPKSMPQLEDRLRSRFEWGLIVDIEPPDYETRLAILQAKAEQKDVNLYADVLDVIAQQVKRNIRELEGSLNRVIAYAKLFRALPTVEMANRALENIASKEPDNTPRTPRLLVESVAESFQLNIADLIGRARDKETVQARRVAMYLMRQETGFTLAQIGEELGGRDAAAVTNACKKISGEINSNTYLKNMVSEIQQKIHPETR